MKFIEALTLHLQTENSFPYGWPEGAKTASQHNSYGVGFYDELGDEMDEFEDVEVDNLPKFDEWDDYPQVTLEEYQAFAALHPNLKEEFDQKARENIPQIAELNRTIAQLINAATILAEEAGITLYIDLGQHGRLNPDSDWDASRC